MTELTQNEITVIKQEISALTDKLKDKQGQVDSCSCMLNTEINQKNIRENKMTLKFMSLYIQEYINLADKYINLNNQLCK